MSPGAQRDGDGPALVLLNHTTCVSFRHRAAHALPTAKNSTPICTRGGTHALLDESDPGRYEAQFKAKSARHAAQWKLTVVECGKNEDHTYVTILLFPATTVNTFFTKNDGETQKCKQRAP